jgi:hypothetical protein
MVQLRCSQAFPILRIVRVAFGRFLRRMPNRLAVPKDGEPPGRDIGGNDGVGIGHVPIKAHAAAAGKSPHRLGSEPKRAAADRGC